MTPQLQQAIKLLQMSAIELTTEIQQALDENPLLEEQGDLDPDQLAAEDDVEERFQEHRKAGDRTSPDDPPYTGNEDNRSGDESDMAQWSEHFESHITGVKNENSAFQIEDRSTQPTTLKDHLLWQMRMTPFTDTDRGIAMTLIDAIDEDGYLQAAVEDLVSILDAEEIQVEPEEVEAVLHQIQNFDPSGVGARDLRECLSIQLRQCDQQSVHSVHAIELVDSHFDLLCNRDLQQLKRAMGLDDDEINQAIRVIQGLHPRPGNAVASVHPGYVVPDVIVKKVKGEWRVELNRDAFPHLRINHSYQALLSRQNGAEEKKYMQNTLQEARWFLKSLDQRNDTLLRVSRSIVERQRDFFEHGEEAMRPMVLNDISSALNLHESTVSRATTHKYMLTPRGIFELKYFFSSHVSTADGGTCSSTAIRKLIRQFVEREPPTKPISDSQIAKLLSQRGINVARRTVAKYRENMNIPASSQRRTIL